MSLTSDEKEHKLRTFGDRYHRLRTQIEDLDLEAEATGVDDAIAYLEEAFDDVETAIQDVTKEADEDDE